MRHCRINYRAHKFGRKGKKMVEYALAGMDNQLFVSTYMLQQPDKKSLEEFLLKQLADQ